MSTTQEGGQRTVIEVLTHDHREVEDMFLELETSTDPQRSRDVTDQVIMELVRHSVAEEQYLYPAVRRLVPDGDALADQELREHAEAEETMKELDGMDPGDERFRPALLKLMQEIRQHVQEEESELFVSLVKSADQQELLDLGSKVEAAKKVAPTRPHPRAPDTPPLNKLLGPATGLIDRMRDALTNRGTGS